MDNKSYQDFYFKKAKMQGYRSRSAFKLIELNKKFNFLKKGIKLLDVGAFPGGWCLVASQNVKNGQIIAIDKSILVEHIGGGDVNRNYSFRAYLLNRNIILLGFNNFTKYFIISF